MEKLFALWKYYTGSHMTLLGGTVTKMLDDGRVSTVEFGPGNYFNPVKVFPTVESGRKVLKEFQDIDAELSNAKLKLEKDYESKLNDLVKKYNF